MLNRFKILHIFCSRTAHVIFVEKPELKMIRFFKEIQLISFPYLIITKVLRVPLITLIIFACMVGHWKLWFKKLGVEGGLFFSFRFSCIFVCLLIYIKKQDIHINIYVAYSRPNGWTNWTEFFCGHSGVARRCYRLIFSNFCFQIFFHGQRRALQVVLHITEITYSYT